MTMHFEPLSPENAALIAHTWRYTGVNSFYDLGPDREGYAEILDAETRAKQYYQIVDNGDLIGWMRIEEVDDALSFNPGLRPDLVGGHRGPGVLEEALAFLHRTWPDASEVRILIPDFNKVTLERFRTAGFITTDMGVRSINGAEYLYRKMSRSLTDLGTAG